MIAEVVIARYANGEIMLTGWGYVNAFLTIWWAVVLGVMVSRRKT